MKVKSSLIHGLLAAILCIATGFTSTVSGQDQDYRRVSLSVRGGAVFGNGGNGFNLLDSRFNTFTESSGLIGFGIQYALTPAWSLEGGYAYTQIRGLSESFETKVNTLSLKNIFNLNQILITNRITNVINPYITAGIGYDMYSYESPAETVDNNSISYNLGAGLAFKLTQTIDLFTHYEYHIASNEADNIIGGDNGFGADVLTNLTGGIRINFGKKGTTHPSWRTVPVEVNPSDYEYFLSQEKRAKELRQEITGLEKQLDQQDRKHAKQVETYTEVIDSLEQKVNHLAMQLQEVRDNLAATPQNQKALESGDTARSIPAGHYVQIFASLGLQSAQNVRSQSKGRLSNFLEDADNQVFIAKRKQFYEVLIGVFNDFSDAENILEVEVKEYDDAFIITFPRPLSLQPLYKDMERVDRIELLGQKE